MQIYRQFIIRHQKWFTCLLNKQKVQIFHCLSLINDPKFSTTSPGDFPNRLLMYIIYNHERNANERNEKAITSD